MCLTGILSQESKSSQWSNKFVERKEREQATNISSDYRDGINKAKNDVLCPQTPRTERQARIPHLCGGDRAGTGGGFVFVLGISQEFGFGVWNG